MSSNHPDGTPLTGCGGIFPLFVIDENYIFTYMENDGYDTLIIYGNNLKCNIL